MSQIKYQIRYFLPIWFSFFCCAWLPDNRFSIRIRGILVSFFLPNRPKGLTLGRDVTLLNVDKLFIKENCYFAKGVWINALGGLEIGKEVILSPYVVVATTRHAFKDGSVRFGGTLVAPVKIGNGSWISSHATISAGSNIGSGCLIGANSVVVGSIADNTVAAGIPAEFKKIRRDNPGDILHAR